MTINRFPLAALALSILSQFAVADDANPGYALAIIKTPEPIEYRMENSMAGGFGWLVHKARNSSMSGRLSSEVFRRASFKPNEILRSEIEASLVKAGLRLSPPPAVSINPVKPYDVKYSAIPLGGNALLHVYIQKIGVQSHSRSSTYQPFIDAVYCLIIPGQEAKGCTYSEESFYGEGITEEDGLFYPADLADQWADEDDVFRRSTSIEPALMKGISKIADGVSKVVINYLAETRPSANQ